MKQKLYSLFLALIFPALAFAVRPYLEPAASAPSGLDAILIDSAANGTRALPWTYFLPMADGWDTPVTAASTGGAVTLTSGEKKILTSFTSDVTFTLPSTPASGTWVKIELQGTDGTHKPIFSPAVYRQGDAASTWTPVPPPAGNHVYALEWDGAAWRMADSVSSGGNAVIYDAQTLTSAQQAQARANMGVSPTPTGSGFPHITAGAQDSAARPINLASGDVTGILPVSSLPGWYGENFVMVQTASGTGSAAANALALKAALAVANTIATPNGIARSPSNPVVILIPPGRYDLGTQTAYTDTVHELNITQRDIYFIGMASDPNAVVITGVNDATGGAAGTIGDGIGQVVELDTCSYPTLGGSVTAAMVAAGLDIHFVNIRFEQRATAIAQNTNDTINTSSIFYSGSSSFGLVGLSFVNCTFDAKNIFGGGGVTAGPQFGGGAGYPTLIFDHCFFGSPIYGASYFTNVAFYFPSMLKGNYGTCAYNTANSLWLAGSGSTTDGAGIRDIILSPGTVLNMLAGLQFISGTTLFKDCDINCSASIPATVTFTNCHVLQNAATSTFGATLIGGFYYPSTNTTFTTCLIKNAIIGTATAATIATGNYPKIQNCKLNAAWTFTAGSTAIDFMGCALPYGWSETNLVYARTSAALSGDLVAPSAPWN